MRTISSAALAISTLILAGCAVTQQQAASGFHPPPPGYHLIVMQPDVAVGQVTAGGVVEQREDWTNQGRDNVLKALAAQEAAQGAVARIATSVDETGWDPAAARDLIALHRAVGAAIAAHKYGAFPLPTKKDHFDWTLGEQAVAFGTATHYDYALFVHARDSFTSGGRVAVQALGILGCALTGVCVVAGGGQQVAYASLVDLKTGNVVWFNVMSSASGDIRTPEGATEMVGKLLAGISAAHAATQKRT
jgi:hypothetical protein